MPSPIPQPGLLGRRSECQTLDRYLEAVRGGESRALVVRGEPGVGQTALLQYAIDAASGMRVVRAVGVESEMELAFAGLQQLCAPMLDRLERLPGPQRDALATAFGLRAGDTPDRFFVGLAALGLLSEVAADQPLLCVVDDAQWLDRASAQALGPVARRLVAESVALVLAARVGGDERELAGLPELVVEGLRDADARALLGSVIRGPLDDRVRDRIVAETRGNPLALLELPRGLTPAELAGGFGLPRAPPLAGRYREAIARLTRTRARAWLARAHLAYGEWLRRQRRRLDAREELRIAHDMLAAMGAAGFAERASRELMATGETARKVTVETRSGLTAQETQIARLARDGLSNPEIGARLFISPRTVEYHLHKVFGKLDISSRTELGGALPGEPKAPLAI